MEVSSGYPSEKFKDYSFKFPIQVSQFGVIEETLSLLMTSSSSERLLVSIKSCMMCLKNWSVPSEIKSIEDKQERVILNTFCSLRSLSPWFLLIFIRRHIFPCGWHTISWNTPRVSFIGSFFFTNFICCLDCYIILHRDWNILWRRDHFTLQRNLIMKWSYIYTITLCHPYHNCLF